jgi:hypothetical protein
VAEVVIEETGVARVVIIPVTIVYRLLKTLILSIVTLLRRRRKVFGSSLLTIKISLVVYILSLPVL